MRFGEKMRFQLATTDLGREREREKMRFQSRWVLAMGFQPWI